MGREREKGELVPFCGCSFLFIIRLLGEGSASVPRAELGQLFHSRKEQERKDIEVEDKGMQEMKRKVDGSGNNGDVKKERHIVTWSQQEDDILREQITIHGTDNWVIIASKFKDKTARQCRRRWYTYLNSDFKKGGWSPEEDTLLCEAQKIFGNRWTEISKVVAGRTDNAVKNRFTTLCKKRAKYEALTKENNFAFINTNNKRVISYNTSILEETSESAVHTKRLR